ncbi:MAG TPA: hypothetical protein DEA40_12485 [Parvularcula sp.]|nr:hypothetical protein [Parvularcula sp.]HBS36420.1 hypothetical protein [Parvularcula sp.]
MPARPDQLALFDPAETPAAEGPSWSRVAGARRAVFGNLAVLRKATPAAVNAPAFVAWEAGFRQLCDLLPEAERLEALRAFEADCARLRALSPQSFE